MIIKTFTAESSSGALKMVRKEMGGDAIVLKTRQVSNDQNRPVFEVTACLEKPTVGQSSKVLDTKASPATRPAEQTPTTSSRLTTNDHINGGASDSTWQDRLLNMESKLDQLLNLGGDWSLEDEVDVYAEVRKLLLKADTPEELAASFVRSLENENESPENPVAFAREKLVEWISSGTLPHLNFKPGDRVVFVGPAGSGKSSVMGKLAANLVVKEKKKICLVTLDDIKMGAHDEVHSYADILGVDVAEPDKVPENVGRWHDAVTLIDTPAMPNDADRISRLKQKIDAINPTHCLAVFSSIVRSSDTVTFSARVKELNPTHIVITMQDLTDKMGSLLAAIAELGQKVAFITDTPGGTGALRSPDPDLMARSLLNLEVSGE